MYTLLLILASALLDRLRGGLLRGMNFWALLNGWVIATILGYGLSWWAAGIAVLFAVGSMPGWGEPMGRALMATMTAPGPDPEGYEWWQVGPLKRKSWLALTGRGAMWGACLLPLAYWIPQVAWVVPAYAIAFPLSVALTLPMPFDGWTRWRISEALRGGLAAALIAYAVS